MLMGELMHSGDELELKGMRFCKVSGAEHPLQNLHLSSLPGSANNSSGNLTKHLCFSFSDLFTQKNLLFEREKESTCNVFFTLQFLQQLGMGGVKARTLHLLRCKAHVGRKLELGLEPNTLPWVSRVGS